MIGVLLLAPRTLALSAENWPEFRGPTGQGISSETKLPTRWSATENVAWKTEIPGLGWSLTMVYGSRVFLITATEEGALCHVISLDLNTGRILWTARCLNRRCGRKRRKTPTLRPHRH